MSHGWSHASQCVQEKVHLLLATTDHLCSLLLCSGPFGFEVSVFSWVGPEYCCHAAFFEVWPECSVQNIKLLGKGQHEMIYWPAVGHAHDICEGLQLHCDKRKAVNKSKVNRVPGRVLL